MLHLFYKKNIGLNFNIILLWKWNKSYEVHDPVKASTKQKKQDLNYRTKELRKIAATIDLLNSQELFLNVVSGSAVISDATTRGVGGVHYLIWAILGRAAG